MQRDRTRQACREFCSSIGARPCFETYAARWTGEGSTCAAARIPGLNCQTAPGIADAMKRAREIESYDDADRQSRFPGT